MLVSWMPAEARQAPGPTNPGDRSSYVVEDVVGVQLPDRTGEGRQIAPYTLARRSRRRPGQPSGDDRLADDRARIAGGHGGCNLVLGDADRAILRRSRP